MIVDKPKLSKATRDIIRRAKNNMKLQEHETSQLEVFNELISDSIEEVVKTKTVKRKNKETGEFEDHTITKLILKKNVDDYNTFRRRKKEYVKGLKSS